MALLLTDGVVVPLLLASMALVTLLFRRDAILSLSCCGDSSIAQVPAQWKITKCATVVGNTIGLDKISHHIQEILIQRVE
jgi:hypothetical protein